MPITPIYQERDDILAHIHKTLTRMEEGGSVTSPRRYETFDEPQTLSEVVEEIVSRVKASGDEAVAELLQNIDGVEIGAKQLTVSDAEFEAARKDCSPELKSSLELMVKRITRYAEKMMPQKESWFEDEPGHRLGWRFTPIDNLGAYVPGGLGGSTPLISSVLMNLIPAKVAGVKNIVVATPCSKDGSVHPALLMACELAGATKVYKAGGAQESRPWPLVRIPAHPAVNHWSGKCFCAEAKRQLFGKIDIDMMAGPSEIAIIADGGAGPSVVAADLIAQAEHDLLASSVMFTDDAQLAEAVQVELEKQLANLPKSDMASQSLRDYGAICVCRDLSEACEFSDVLAPEHLELSVADPKALVPQLQHAGAISWATRPQKWLGITRPALLTPCRPAVRLAC